MAKRSNSINISTNNSSALVAPQRSEIRISFSIEYPSISVSTRKKLRKTAFVATFLVLATLSSCTVLDVQMSRSMVCVLMLLGSIGLVYCFHTLWKMFGGWDGIVNHEEQEGGKR